MRVGVYSFLPPSYIFKEMERLKCHTDHYPRASTPVARTYVRASIARNTNACIKRTDHPHTAEVTEVNGNTKAKGFYSYTLYAWNAISTDALRRPQ